MKDRAYQNSSNGGSVLADCREPQPQQQQQQAGWSITVASAAAAPTQSGHTASGRVHLLDELVEERDERTGASRPIHQGEQAGLMQLPAANSNDVQHHHHHQQYQSGSNIMQHYQQAHYNHYTNYSGNSSSASEHYETTVGGSPAAQEHQHRRAQEPLANQQIQQERPTDQQHEPGQSEWPSPFGQHAGLSAESIAYMTAYQQQLPTEHQPHLHLHQPHSQQHQQVSHEQQQYAAGGSSLEQSSHQQLHHSQLVPQSAEQLHGRQHSQHHHQMPCLTGYSAVSDPAGYGSSTAAALYSRYNKVAMLHHHHQSNYHQHPVQHHESHLPSHGSGGQPPTQQHLHQHLLQETHEQQAKQHSFWPHHQLQSLTTSSQLHRDPLLDSPTGPSMAISQQQQQPHQQQPRPHQHHPLQQMAQVQQQQQHDEGCAEKKVSMASVSQQPVQTGEQIKQSYSQLVTGPASCAPVQTGSSAANSASCASDSSLLSSSSSSSSSPSSSLSSSSSSFSLSDGAGQKPASTSAAPAKRQGKAGAGKGAQSGRACAKGTSQQSGRRAISRRLSSVEYQRSGAKSSDAIHEAATYKDADIEHTSTHIIVTNTESGQLVELTNDQLTRSSVRDLNRMVSGFPRHTITKLKQRRRTLKNRGYAQNCRLKRVDQKNKLEKQNGELREENANQARMIQELREKVLYYSRELSLVRRHVDKLQQQQQVSSDVEAEQVLH